MMHSWKIKALNYVTSGKEYDCQMTRGFAVATQPVRCKEGCSIAQEIAQRFAVKLNDELLPGYTYSEITSSLNHKKDYIQIETPGIESIPGSGIKLLAWFVIEANNAGYTWSLYVSEQWLGVTKFQEHSHFSVQQGDARLRDVTPPYLIFMNSTKFLGKTLGYKSSDEPQCERYFSYEVFNTANALHLIALQLWSEATNEAQENKPYKQSRGLAQAKTPNFLTITTPQEENILTEAKHLLLVARTVAATGISVALGVLLGLGIGWSYSSSSQNPAATVVGVFLFILILLCIISFSRFWFAKQRADIELMTRGPMLTVCESLKKNLARIYIGMAIASFYLGAIGTLISSFAAVVVWHRRYKRVIAGLEQLQIHSIDTSKNDKNGIEIDRGNNLQDLPPFGN